MVSAKRYLPQVFSLFLLTIAFILVVSSTTTTSVFAATTSFRPTPIPTTEPDVIGPFRGLYDWRTTPEAPVGSFDTYQRYNWRELEPTRGVYNFSRIDTDMMHARAAGKRHGFRIRAMVSLEGVAVPDYLQTLMPLGWWGDADKNGVNDTYVPDWNDPDFLSRFEALMTALGARYANHPDLAYIDIAGYGNWGEFHMTPFKPPYPSAAQPATLPTIYRIIDAHLAAFNPNNPLGPRLAMMSENSDALMYAFEKSPRIGWRRDSLGSTQFTDNGGFAQSWNEPLRRRIIAQRWKTAPIVVEFIQCPCADP
jgi:hypothetical protein